MKKFKLIKEFPLSPKIGTIVIFENEQHELYDIGAIPCLLLSDCEDWPEFWEQC